MNEQPRYVVVLLPTSEIAAEGLRLGEAISWMRAYNEVMCGDFKRAAVAESSPTAGAAAH